MLGNLDTMEEMQEEVDEARAESCRRGELLYWIERNLPQIIDNAKSAIEKQLTHDIAQIIAKCTERKDATTKEDEQ